MAMARAVVDKVKNGYRDASRQVKLVDVFR